jgi:hypothetical protein
VSHAAGRTQYLVDLVAAVLFKVATDVAQERNVADARGDEQQQGTSEDDDGEDNRAGQGVGDESAVGEVLAQVVPVALNPALREVEGVKRDGVDGLPRAIS